MYFADQEKLPYMMLFCEVVRLKINIYIHTGKMKVDIYNCFLFVS